jgi:hypothetical protein
MTPPAVVQELDEVGAQAVRKLSIASPFDDLQDVNSRETEACSNSTWRLPRAQEAMTLS